MANERYDVVVVGGGAAGLSGAVALARSRRSVLVIDAGEPRNAPAAHVHNYLGRESSPPAELLGIGREEVAAYGGEVVGGTVTHAEPLPSGGFRVTLADGREYASRRLLVTTGLVDELPDVPGVRQLWGSEVLHCPYCHGWEARDRAVGILATSPMAAHGAILWRQLTEDVVVFQHTEPPFGAEVLEQFEARGIRVVQGKVTELEHRDGRLAGIRLASGELVARDVAVVAPRFTARSGVLAGLGLETVEMRMGDYVVGTHVPSDPTGATDVPGVWVAGNVTNLMAQVVVAAGGGLSAGAAINADLAQEDTRQAVAMRSLFSEDGWEQRYRENSGLWSGKPNAQLVTQAGALKPGTALDAGCGEGHDALWLAERGWQVTGADFSRVALDRARAHAAEAGVQVEWLHANLVSWDPPGRYDLVTSHFLHLPRADRVVAFARLAEAVVPGGTLLIVGHDPSDLRTSVHRADFPEMWFTADEVVAALGPKWTVEVADSLPREVLDADGKETTIHDVVIRARRDG